MNSNGILHFTVNSKGWLRMHETAQDAVAMKQKDEVVVYLSLTRTQVATILKAESVARSKAS